MESPAVSKERVRRNFDRAAPTYASEAALQRSLARSLAGFDPPDPGGGPVLDLGAGTGFVGQALKRVRPARRIVATDLSLPMLEAAPRGACDFRVAGDAERLPFRDGAFPEAVSGLALQWVPDLRAALAEVRRVLAPGGFLRASLFVEGTLSELRDALARALRNPPPPHPLPDPRALRAHVEAAGLAVERLEVVHRRVPFPTLRALLLHLGRIGARSAASGSRLANGDLRSAEAAYRRLHGQGALLPATFAAAFIRARKV